MIRYATLDAPIDQIPLLVRAGSIIPMGPFLQYHNEKPPDPLEIRLYPGNSGTFTLYEDDGLTQQYKDGQYTTIEFYYDGFVQFWRHFWNFHAFLVQNP